MSFTVVNNTFLKVLAVPIPVVVSKSIASTNINTFSPILVYDILTQTCKSVIFVHHSSVKLVYASPLNVISQFQV